MTDVKTKRTGASVSAFLGGVKDDRKRKDCKTLAKIMREATKAAPKMWGPSIVGFGSRHHRYASGREGDWFLTGFSPRKQSLTLYIMDGFTEYDALSRRLGKHNAGKACLYINRLEDVDLSVLREIIERSVERMTGGRS